MKKSQVKQLVNFAKRRTRKGITMADLAFELGILRGSARLADVESLGGVWRSEWESNGNARYKRYWLVKAPEGF